MYDYLIRLFRIVLALRFLTVAAVVAGIAAIVLWLMQR